MVYSSKKERSDPEQVLSNSPSNASSTDGERHPLGLAPPTSDELSCFSVHNFLLIRGNPVPDDRLFNENDKLPEQLNRFIHGHMSSHAQEPVLDYFRINVPLNLLCPPSNSSCIIPTPKIFLEI